jgi:hypothetical protein
MRCNLFYHPQTWLAKLFKFTEVFHLWIIPDSPSVFLFFLLESFQEINVVQPRLKANESQENTGK